MNHWLHVGLDILVVVKYLLPFVGSFMISVTILSLADIEEKHYYAAFVVSIIGVSLYVW